MFSERSFVACLLSVIALAWLIGISVLANEPENQEKFGALRRQSLIKMGETAPELVLPELGGKIFNLSSSIARGPVLLIFASDDSPSFPAWIERISFLEHRGINRGINRGKLSVVLIYVREQGHESGSLFERKSRAKALKNRYRLNMPVLVDHMDDCAAKTWSAWPEGLVLLDKKKRVAALMEEQIEQIEQKERIGRKKIDSSGLWREIERAYSGLD